MKKQTSINLMVRSLFIVLIAMMSSAVMADGTDQQVQLQKRNGKNISLRIQYQQPSSFEIRITDDRNVELLGQTFESVENFARLFDLSQLPVGNYYLEIEDNIKVTKWEINIDPTDLMFEVVEEFHIPQFIKEDKKVRLSFLSTNLPEARIMIYDDAGIVVYEEKIDEENPVERVFDFSRVPPNNFVIKTSFGSRNFRYYVND